MDFDIDEETEYDENFEDDDNNSSKKNNNDKLPIIIIATISIVAGLTVYFISNAILGKKTVKVVPQEATQLSLTDENVEILYAYVSYGTRNKRNDKFLVEKKVDLSSFSNQEKFYYALQFAQVEDFIATSKVDANNLKIYNISANKIKTYMQRFFGSRVTFSMDEVITYPFSFRIGGKNVGVLTPSNAGDGFDTVFTEFQEDLDGKDLVEPFYTELTAAQKNPDGSYQLTEKAIYTEVSQHEDKYTINIYSDPDHSKLIETKTNQTEEMLKQRPISIANYKDKATTITYLFKVNGTVLYFDSSMIGNKIDNSTNTTNTNTNNN